ncbi:P-loop containing nucleoside triphosphate hydrolase protein [Lasiosphaeria ovina]|uniref:P-loop containing nucleoside triphosphate hydrolase protein n=1 Tax=Lasiosphaeria ovina TaxID=92902 RepID=A0AAE0N249_9PEZI|nr:P-loop containing nucleoside triphosphate hydrolase protein [Lasiosphaeria ovina]
MLSERWQAAVKKARATVGDEKFKEIQNFDSGDALLADLKRRQVKADKKKATCRVLGSHLLDHDLGVESDFARSMNRVESSIQHLKDLAQLDSMSKMTLRDARFARQDDMFSSPDLEEDVAQLSVVLLPQAVNNAAFYGRDDVLSKIESILDQPDSTMPTLHSVLLHGMGGVGKSQTAMNYAHTRQDKYQVILWIRSETPLSLNASMTEIARRLSFPGSDSPGSDESNLSHFHKWLSRRAARKNGPQLLLIYDNVPQMDDNLQKYMPRAPGHVIITSRNRRTEFSATSSLISLRPFSAEAGGILLKRLLRYPQKQLLGEADEKATTALAKEVGGLPLGIRHMAGLMNERSDSPASTFYDKYMKFPRELMMQAGPAVDYEKDISRSGDEHPLDRVWTISFGSLKLPQRTLLGIASLLSPDQIPQYLFSDKCLKDAPVGDLRLVCSVVGLDMSLVGLANIALIDRNSDPFSIHRLVQDAFRHWCDEKELSQHFASAVHLVHQFFPRQVNGRPMHDCWNRCRELIQHGQILADRFEEMRKRWPDIEAPPSLVELLKSCAWYLFEMADHHSTIRLLEIAISACPDTQSELYAHLQNTIGCCSFELSDLRRCRQVWDKALAIRQTWAKKKIPGAEEELANQLNNYGNLESAEGHYDPAMRYFDQAKAIRLRLGNEAIVPLGVTYMTTGRALFLKGEYGAALTEYKKAEDIFVAKFGQEAHFMAQNLLDKGLTIAEFREGTGDVARIARKKAAILAAGSPEEQATSKMLLRQVEDIVMTHFPNEVLVLESDAEDDWDIWVCPYWR